MSALIIKLNATGDVVRTTPLLHRLNGEITWITAAKNVVLLKGLTSTLRCLPWEERGQTLDREYDLVISLEDELEVATFVKALRYRQLFGAFLNGDGSVRYTDDSRRWFDLSLISIYGRQRADELKFLNRQTYQQLIFDGLGLCFDGAPYQLPQPAVTELSGDVAIASVAGPVWPMKNWAYYDDLRARLEADGLRVNVLPHRLSLLEHLGDIAQHRVLVGGDSLPMHFALGVGTRCVSIFNCTSPWEIHDYGIQTQVISPLLGEFFYKRGMNPRATMAISLEEVLAAVTSQLRMPNKQGGAQEIRRCDKDECGSGR
jgi:ADP-heptose:LPS heptosyltransferase